MSGDYTVVELLDSKQMDVIRKNNGKTMLGELQLYFPNLDWYSDVRNSTTDTYIFYGHLVVGKSCTWITLRLDVDDFPSRVWRANVEKDVGDVASHMAARRFTSKCNDCTSIEE
jgi:hypothetical protein